MALVLKEEPAAMRGWWRLFVMFVAVAIIEDYVYQNRYLAQWYRQEDRYLVLIATCSVILVLRKIGLYCYEYSTVETPKEQENVDQAECCQMARMATIERSRTIPATAAAKKKKKKPLTRAQYRERSRKAWLERQEGMLTDRREETRRDDITKMKSPLSSKPSCIKPVPEFCQPTNDSFPVEFQLAAPPPTIFDNGMVRFRHLVHLPKADQAAEIMRQLANTFVPIMKLRGYDVQSVSEFCCCGDGLDYELINKKGAVCIKPGCSIDGHHNHDQLLGYNQYLPHPIRRYLDSCTIHVRIRNSQNHIQIMDYEEVAATMAHEMAHCVHRHHDPKFWELYEELMKEANIGTSNQQRNDRDALAAAAFFASRPRHYINGPNPIAPAQGRIFLKRNDIMTVASETDIVSSQVMRSYLNLLIAESHHLGVRWAETADYHLLLDDGDNWERWSARVKNKSSCDIDWQNDKIILLPIFSKSATSKGHWTLLIFDRIGNSDGSFVYFDFATSRSDKRAFENLQSHLRNTPLCSDNKKTKWLSAVLPKETVSINADCGIYSLCVASAYIRSLVRGELDRMVQSNTFGVSMVFHNSIQDFGSHARKQVLNSLLQRQVTLNDTLFLQFEIVTSQSVFFECHQTEA